MTAWDVWALTVVALFLKMFGIALLQGAVRGRARAFVKPEDAAFFGRGAAPAAEEPPLAARGQRLLGNDLENIPLFLFLSAGYIQLGGALSLVAGCCGVFVAARVGHTIFFLRQRQPHRAGFFALGALCSLVLSGAIVLRVLS